MQSSHQCRPSQVYSEVRVTEFNDMDSPKSVHRIAAVGPKPKLPQPPQSYMGTETASFL